MPESPSKVVGLFAGNVHKIQNFHPISCCENFVERLSFRRILGDLPETLRKLRLSIKFPQQEIK